MCVNRKISSPTSNFHHNIFFHSSFTTPRGFSPYSHLGLTSLPANPPARVLVFTHL
jgi:hypothetical protein